MLDRKTREKFAILGMLYACLWEYLDHFANTEHWSEILPFSKDEVQGAAKKHYESVMVPGLLGPDLTIRVFEDWKNFFECTVRIEKALGSETINDRKFFSGFTV